MGEGRGVVVSCGKLGEGPVGSPFLSVEIFHEMLIWSNTVNPRISIYLNFGRKRGAYLRGGGGA